MTTNKRKYHEIALKIEEKLMSGVYKIGERLPSERELSVKYNTTRAIIREAIVMLEVKELVEVKKGSGIFFTTDKTKQNEIKLKDTSTIENVGPFELLQARSVLETSIVKFAAKIIKINELRQLRLIIEQQEALGNNNEQFEKLDRAFHLCIAEATQNRMIIDTAKRLWNNVRTENPLWQRMNQQYLQQPHLKEKWLNEHKKILAALQSKDPELAYQAMSEHLEHGQSELSKLVDFEDPNLIDLEDIFFLDLEHKE